VSVVIPTYNRGELLIETIESILAQTAKPGEVIVVDDGSTDDTQERLARYADRVRYVRQPNQGVAAARNHGVREARGKWIAFIDSDDVWHPRKLECQLRVLADYPDLGILGTALFNWPAPEFPNVSCEVSGKVTFIPWDRLVVRNYLATSSVIARRDVLDRVGEFDTNLQGPEDRDLWLRIGETAAVANLKTPLTGYRVVPGSVSRQASRVHQSMVSMLRKLDERGAWRGRRLLRRKSYSYIYYTSFVNFRECGQSLMALGMIARSLAWYPFPYEREVEPTLFARPKSLIATLLRIIGIKRIAMADP